MSKTAMVALSALVLLLIGLPWVLNPYILQIVILTVTYTMLGLAFALSLKVGLLRFDVAGWWGVGAYVTALLMQKAHMSFWMTLPIAGLVAIILGYVVFFVAMPRGMLVFFLFGMIASMALHQIFGSVKFLGGWGGTGIVPSPRIGSFEFTGKPELYYLGLLFLGAMYAVYYLLYNSKTGRAWNAIGSSPKLAGSIGVNVVRYRMANVLIGNFFLAIAGSYHVAYSLAAVPASFSLGNSIYTMMYVVVGGLLHSLLGPLVGAAIITFVPEYLRTAKEYEPIITSTAIILIIIFMPLGVLGLYSGRIQPWLNRRFFPGRSEGKGIQGSH